ncbi:MAG: hypothetical protein Q8L14_41605 [Myxococcales bacterium]|nr:hypothetical protein [Myxococcales bacterium]
MTEFSTVGRPFNSIAGVVTVLSVSASGSAQCDDGLHEIESARAEVFDEAGNPISLFHNADFDGLPSRVASTTVAFAPPPGVVVIRITTNLGVMERRGFAYHGYWPTSWESLPRCFPLELPDGGVYCRGNGATALTDSLAWEFSGRSVEARRIDDESRDASFVHRDVFSDAIEPVFATRGSRLVVAAPDALFVFDEDAGVRQLPLQARIQALRFRDDTTLFAARGQLTEVISLEAPFSLSSQPGEAAEVLASDEGFWRVDRSRRVLSIELPDGGRLEGKAPNDDLGLGPNGFGRVPFFRLGLHGDSPLIGVARLTRTGEVRVDAIPLRRNSDPTWLSTRWLYASSSDGVVRVPRTME